jgi:hypothetical protein
MKPVIFNAAIARIAYFQTSPILRQASGPWKNDLMTSKMDKFNFPASLDSRR